MKVGMIGVGSIAGIMVGIIKEVDCAQNYTVAAKNYGRAAEFTQEYSFEKVCRSYEELVEDTEVKLVYIATPHPYHYEHIKLCLNHGRHVLCEKSSTVNESRAGGALELVRKKELSLTEVIRTRCMPTRRTLDDALLGDIIDRPYMLTADLDHIISGKERIIRPELARGVLLDAGIYPLDSASMVFEDEMDTITGTMAMTKIGVDTQNSIIITCKDGRMAVPYNSAVGLSDRRGIIYDDSGFTEVENINNCKGIRVYDRSENMTAPYNTPKQISGYEYEVEAYLRVIEERALGYPEMSRGETLQVMGWMDRLRRQWGLIYPTEK